MPVDVICPQCGSELEAPDRAAGKKVKCPDCGTAIAVPSGGADEPAAEERVRAEPSPASGKPARRRDEDRAPRRRNDDDDDMPRRRRDDDDVVSTLIPYKNARALVAYYLGIFSLIPCLGLLLGPAALILGILGLRYAGAHRKAKGQGHAWAGIILGSLTTLGNWGFVLVGVLGGILSGR